MDSLVLLLLMQRIFDRIRKLSRSSQGGGFSTQNNPIKSGLFYVYKSSMSAEGEAIALPTYILTVDGR